MLQEAVFPVFCSTHSCGQLARLVAQGSCSRQKMLASTPRNVTPLGSGKRVGGELESAEGRFFIDSGLLVRDTAQFSKIVLDGERL